MLTISSDSTHLDERYWKILCLAHAAPASTLSLPAQQLFDVIIAISAADTSVSLPLLSIVAEALPILKSKFGLRVQFDNCVKCVASTISHLLMKKAISAPEAQSFLQVVLRMLADSQPVTSKQKVFTSTVKLTLIPLIFAYGTLKNSNAAVQAVLDLIVKVLFYALFNTPPMLKEYISPTSEQPRYAK